jgi:hypothetical protein
MTNGEAESSSLKHHMQRGEKYPMNEVIWVDVVYQLPLGSSSISVTDRGIFSRSALSQRVEIFVHRRSDVLF